MPKDQHNATIDWVQRAVDAEEALRDIRAALRNEGRLNDHSISDTIWIGPAETVVDRINGVLGDE